MAAFEEQVASLTVIDITSQSPSKSELLSAISQLGIKRVFNTSGQRYRELGIKDKLIEMSSTEVVELLHDDGMLIKRPFIVDDEDIRVGFK